jgi:hypothetical protein
LSDEKEDKDRTDEVLDAIEGMRQQNSVQHDEQLSGLRLLNELLMWLKSWASRLHK